MRILRATLEQLEPVSVLFDQYRQFYEQPPDLDACRRYIEARLSGDESVIFCARADDGEFIGFTQLYHSFCSVDMAPLVYLYDLYVKPAVRRQGVGWALMKAAEQHARDSGAGRMQLETALTNIPGQELYERLGWERDEEFYTYHLTLGG
jgi:ribosomal protein S18 acetylase RimI-like enzyme